MVHIPSTVSVSGLSKVPVVSLRPQEGKGQWSRDEDQLVICLGLKELQAEMEEEHVCDVS